MKSINDINEWKMNPLSKLQSFSIFNLISIFGKAQKIQFNGP